MLYDIEEVKRLRKKHGLTQVQLAKLANVSQSFVAKLESHKIDPAYSKLKRIFESLERIRNKDEQTAADLMTAKIYWGDPSANINEVIKTMRNHEISQIPIHSGGVVIGLLSEESIVDAISKGEDTAIMQVSDLMDDSPPIVSTGTPVRAVMELLKLAPLVLVQEKGKYKGLISKADILKGLKH